MQNIDAEQYGVYSFACKYIAAIMTLDLIMPCALVITTHRHFDRQVFANNTILRISNLLFEKPCSLVILKRVRLIILIKMS